MDRTGGEIVAEFQNIIKQLNRLCKMNFNSNNCSNTCPLELLHKKYLDAPSCKEELFVHTKEVEQIVSEWAAEHPEPIYPTWGEYLASIGVMKPAKPDETYEIWFTQLYSTNIPADIAQKLGLQPKEG